MGWKGVEAFVESLDASTREDLGNPRPNHIVKKHLSNIIRLYFDNHPHGLIKYKKLKCTTKVLGFQDAKRRKAHVIVIENLSKAFSKFGKSRKLDV